MIITFYNSFKKKTLEKKIDFVNDTIRVALLANTYTPDQDAHDFFNDVQGDEVAGAGYVAGGAALVNKTVTQDDAGNKGVFNADDVVWANSTLVARYAALYKATGVAATSPLIVLLDLEADEESSDSDFTIRWGAGGIITVGE